MQILAPHCNPKVEHPNFYLPRGYSNDFGGSCQIKYSVSVIITEIVKLIYHGHMVIIHMLADNQIVHTIDFSYNDYITYGRYFT